MSTKPQTFKEITKEQVDQWKEKYNKVELITVPTDEDDEVASFYARFPSVAQMRAITEITSDKKKGILAGTDAMMNSIILGGDMKYLSNDEKDASIYNAVMSEVGEMASQKKATRRAI